MQDNVNAERIIATICASKLPRFERAAHLHFHLSCLRVADWIYPQFTRLFYTFYTILSDWNPHRVDSEGKARHKNSDRKSVESVDAEVDGHVTNRQARVGKCRR